MAEFEMRLRFTAANYAQAERLAEAWADTCAAEYGTRLAGRVYLVNDSYTISTDRNTASQPSQGVTE